MLVIPVDGLPQARNLLGHELRFRFTRGIRVCPAPMNEKKELVGDANRPWPTWSYAFPPLLYRPGRWIGRRGGDGKAGAFLQREERSLKFASADAALPIAVCYLDRAGVAVVRLRVRGQRDVVP